MAVRLFMDFTRNQLSMMSEHGMAGATRRKRIDSGDNLGNRRFDRAIDLDNWESLK